MITKSEWEEARQWAWDYIKKAGVVVKDEDFNLIEVVDLGLGEIQSTGLQILTFFSTEWVGVKLLILRPHQFFPQHKHPPSKVGSYPGKTEIFRGQCGILYLYVPGKATTNPKANPPSHHKRYINVWHEIVIFPGDQYVNHPNTWHWFQAGIEGAAVWSFSSKVTDAEDQFMDPSIIRKTIVVEG